MRKLVRWVIICLAGLPVKLHLVLEKCLIRTRTSAEQYDCCLLVFKSCWDFISLSINLMNYGAPRETCSLRLEVNGDNFVAVWTIIYWNNFNRYVFNSYGNNIVGYIKLYDILYNMTLRKTIGNSWYLCPSEMSSTGACVRITVMVVSFI